MGEERLERVGGRARAQNILAVMGLFCPAFCLIGGCPGYYHGTSSGHILRCCAVRAFAARLCRLVVFVYAHVGEFLHGFETAYTFQLTTEVDSFFFVVASGGGDHSHPPLADE